MIAIILVLTVWNWIGMWSLHGKVDAIRKAQLAAPPEAHHEG